jgi:hypothetical protein
MGIASAFALRATADKSLDPSYGLHGLGDIQGLLAAITPILPNSCRSSSDIDKSD